MHVAQLEEFVLLVEQGQAAPSPIRCRKAALANCAALAFVPFAQKAIHILRRRIDLRQAFLAAIAFVRPAGSRLQPRMLLAARAVQNAYSLSVSMSAGCPESGQIADW